MKNKKIKGQYGYRQYHRKVQLILVLCCVVAILLQLAARGLTASQSAKNILTVMAVLSVLPMANIASPLIAGWKYKTGPESLYKKIILFEDRFVLLYDLTITSREMILPFDAVAVHPSGVYGYCPLIKTDIKKAEKFINEMLTSNKLDPGMKIITDETAFLRRLEGLKPADTLEDDGSVAYTAALLKSLSM